MININKKIFKILTKKQRFQLIGLFFLMFIGGILESMGVSLVFPLITGVLSETEWNETWYASLICDWLNINSQKVYIEILLIALIFVFILKNGYLMLEYYIQYGFISKSRYHLQKSLIHKYVYSPYTYYLDANSGQIIRVLSNDTYYVFTLLSMLLTMYTEIIVSIILVVTIIFISPFIALGSGIFLMLELIIIFKLVKPVMKREGKKVIDENAKSNSWVLQIVNGIKSIKSSSKEEYFESNYNVHIYNAINSSRISQFLGVIPRLIIESVTILAVLGMILAQVINGGDISLIIPQLSAFAVAAMRLLPSVNRISSSVNQIPYYESALDSVLDCLAIDYDINHLHTEAEITAGVKFEKNIEINNVSFKYTNSDFFVLDNAYLKIRKGTSVGIIGASGAGKTTVVDILLGLLKPDNGGVYVDENNISQNITGWHSILSYIPQNVFLIDDSIRKNVAFGIDENCIDDKQIWESLKEAQLDDFVRSLPEGLDTGVGERGVKLSGGQCQRIGIARALYKKPKIIFFDEATSALDNDTELAIMEAIDNLKGKKTLVVVAHRLSTIKNCDYVYKVENGKIVLQE